MTTPAPKSPSPALPQSLPAPVFEALFKAASAARANAHAPYSKFKVGCAVVDERGRVFVGCNTEVANYVAGRCAEGNAIGAMVAAGGTHIREILVVGGEAGGGLCTPCGTCRQVIREFAALDCPVHVADAGGYRQSFTLDELLPHSFGPENLG